MRKQRLPFRRFHHRLFLLILLLTLAPVLIVGSANILLTSNLFTGQLEESSDMILSRTAAPFEQLYQEFETTERLFLHDEELVQALHSSELSVIKQTAVANRLLQYLNNIKYINADFRISFLLPKEHYLSHYGLPVKAGADFIDKLSLDPGNLRQIYRLSNSDPQGDFTWVVPIGSITDRELYGCMLITIPYSSISALLGEPLDSGQRQYLIAGNALEEDILVGPRGAENDRELAAGLRHVGDYLDAGRPEASYTEGGSYYSTRKVGEDWTLLGIVPRKHVLFPLYKVYQWTAGVMGLLLLISTLVSSRLVRNFSRPIERLASLVVRKKSDGAHLNIPPLVRDDEIGILYDGIRELLLEIREEQVLKREYHLRLLQYQINPHFLYNSLDTINWKALEHRDRELTGMIEYLTVFLRAGLDGADVVTLEQELKHLNSYIGMQQIRYKEQFEITVDIEPELLQQEIAKISLQPLVENAIMHGMNRQAGGNIIVITGRRTGEVYTIGVFDNGRVLDLSKVERLLSEKEPERSDSFGIRNVHERIRLYFGEPYGLQVKELEQGKCFELLLPFTINGGH